MVCNAAANVIETGNVLNVENVTTMLAETGGLGSDYAIETAKARLKKLVRLCELGIGEHYPRITHGGWGQERLRAAGCEQIGEMFERVYKESPDALMAAIEKGHREGFSD